MIEVLHPDVENDVAPLTMPYQLILQLARIVLDSPDAECCGFLVGPDGADGPTSIIRVTNIADDPRTEYEMETDDLLSVAQFLEDTGGQMFAAWHSHIVGGARPSELDRSLVVPGLPYQLIAAIVGPERVAMTAHLGDWSVPAALAFTEGHSHCVRDGHCVSDAAGDHPNPLCAGCAS